jgi:hypothetical protein
MCASVAFELLVFVLHSNYEIEVDDFKLVSIVIDEVVGFDIPM